MRRVFRIGYRRFREARKAGRRAAERVVGIPKRGRADQQLHYRRSQSPQLETSRSERGAQGGRDTRWAVRVAHEREPLQRVHARREHPLQDKPTDACSSKRESSRLESACKARQALLWISTTHVRLVALRFRASGESKEYRFRIAEERCSRASIPSTVHDDRSRQPDGPLSPANKRRAPH